MSKFCITKLRFFHKFYVGKNSKGIKKKKSDFSKSDKKQGSNQSSDKGGDIPRYSEPQKNMQSLDEKLKSKSKNPFVEENNPFEIVEDKDEEQSPDNQSKKL